MPIKSSIVVGTFALPLILTLMSSNTTDLGWCSSSPGWEVRSREILCDLLARGCVKLGAARNGKRGAVQRIPQFHASHSSSARKIHRAADENAHRDQRQGEGDGNVTALIAHKRRMTFP